MGELACTLAPTLNLLLALMQPLEQRYSCHRRSFLPTLFP